MFKRISMSVFILSLLTTVPALTPAARAQSVAYEKLELPNGMTVILHEDHSLPIACINTWYYVGSKDERRGRSGFAHLFEHLMFMGTDRVPGGDFDTIMETGGGYNNASTSEDRTNYFSMGPAELLATLLWLDADRLEDLGKAMTQEKLDKQRDVVRNERRQSSEIQPYGRARLKVSELMYPEGHPYHHTVIGSHEDLEAGTLDDVKNFFSTYYIPSNASLVVAGDFDPKVIKPLVEDLFGTLPRGSDPVHKTAGPVRLDKVKRLTMADNVQFARTYMVYHSPAQYQPGDAEMDLAASILTDGISSRLYQELVYKNQLAVDVAAYQDSRTLGSLFYIQATARAGVSLESLETAIDQTVAAFVDSGPAQEELERQKSKIEYRSLSRLQSILAKADRLNRYQFAFGEPDSFKRDLDRYRNATAAGVRKWAEQVLTPDARLVMRVIPELKAEGENPRDTRPQLEGSDEFKPLMPETFTLSNGIKVYHWHRTELPLVAVTMMFPYGTTSDPAGKAGLATLTADMLDEGAGSRGAVEFADALDALGANFGAWSGRESTTVELSTLVRNLDPALALFADAVQRPRFDEKEWKRVHDLHLQMLKRAVDRPNYVARTVAMRSFFGGDNPYGVPRSGTIMTASAVALEDVRSFHKSLYRPSDAVLLIAGDLTAQQANAHLEKAFGDWQDPQGAAGLSQPKRPAAKKKPMRVYLVDRPEAVQSVITFVMPGPVYADPNRPELELLNTILGGSFTSRLNQNLREEHGFTYGAGSSYSMNPSVGYFTASSSVRADVTGASVSEFLKEFHQLRGGNVSADEAEKASATRRMEMMQAFSGLSGLLDAAVTLVRNHRPFSALGDELSQIAGAGEKDLNQLAYNAIPLDNAVLVIVGDAKTVREQLAGLDLPAPEELTVTGDPKYESSARPSVPRP